MEPDALLTVARHFGQYRRPLDYINRQHCDECAEHYETLFDIPAELLAREHVGDGAWDSSGMLTPDAFTYYFPALARIADVDREGWLDMFIMRLAVYYTDTFRRDDWPAAAALLESWWIDEQLSQFTRDGVERALDVCRRHRIGS